MSTFSSRRQEQIECNKNNVELLSSAQTFFERSVESKYSYGFDWLGLPIIQYPQDIIALQEIIYSTKPNIIIETGFGRGGSVMLYASILDLIHSESDPSWKVISVEIDFNKKGLDHIRQSKYRNNVHFLTGSSIDPDVINSVKKYFSSSDSVMVILDSLHTYDHVSAELDYYSKFVSKGNFICVMDTAIGYLPESASNDRPWSPSNSPLQAANNFMDNNNEFVLRNDIDLKLLISVAKSGYIQRIK